MTRDTTASTRWPPRAALWDHVSAAPFLTMNEKREAVGYGAGGGRG